MTHRPIRRTDMTRLAVDGSAPAAEVARIVNQLLDGRDEAHGSVTLLNGTTETVIRSPILTGHSIINLVPTDAAGAAVQWFQKEATDRNTVVVGHADPGADLDFLWTVRG